MSPQEGLRFGLCSRRELGCRRVPSPPGLGCRVAGSWEPCLPGPPQGCDGVSGCAFQNQLLTKGMVILRDKIRFYEGELGSPVVAAMCWVALLAGVAAGRPGSYQGRWLSRCARGNHGSVAVLDGGWEGSEGTEMRPLGQQGEI